MPTARRKIHIAIVGGGFAGAYAAIHLGREWKEMYPEMRITLLEASDWFTFKPLLPEIIPGKIAPEVTRISLCTLSKRYGFDLRRAVVKRIDLETRQVWANKGVLSYDYLILAPGGEPDFYGSKELRKSGFVLNSSEDAVRIRQTVIKQFSEVRKETDPEKRKAMLRFVVAGGGPAGVEVASEVHLFIRKTLLRFFSADPAEAEVVLVHGGSRILPGLPEGLVARGEQVLQAKGIRLLLNTRVQGMKDGRIFLKGKVSELCSETLIWSAGMRASRMLDALSVAKDRKGAVLVDEYLKIPEYPGVYVAGDCASVYNWKRRSNYPALAPVAIRQGVLAARNIMLEVTRQPKEEFRFFQTGQIISLGAGEALGNVLGISFQGRIGWLIYRLAYFLKLIGVRNKLLLIWHRLRGKFCPALLTLQEGNSV